MRKQNRPTEAEQQRALELLRQLPTPEPPGELRSRVIAAVRARPARRRWLPHLAAAGACLALGLTWLALRPSGVVAVPADSFATAGFVAEHTVLTAADPLTDSAGWYAVGAVAGRAAAGHGWPEEPR